MKAAGLMLAGMLAVLTPAVPATGEPGPARCLFVFAAASASELMRAFGDRFETTGDACVTVVTAASSTLARQIAEGAPADLVVSANRTWIDWLEERGAIDPGSERAVFANRLAIIVRSDENAAFGSGLAAKKALLEDRGPIAVAGPAVPAGVYARQALKRTGLLPAVEARLVPGSSVRNTLLFVERREARYGIGYLSDALLIDGLKAAALFAPDAHDPIVYVAALVARESRHGSSSLFLETLSVKASQPLIARHGFRPADG